MKTIYGFVGLNSTSPAQIHLIVRILVFHLAGKMRGGVATRGETKERAVIMTIIIAVRTVVMVTTMADTGLTATEANIFQGPHRWTTTVTEILTAVRLVTVHLRELLPPPMNRTGKSAPRNYTK